MQTPVYTESEARTRGTFLAMMWALSRPGVVFQLPEDCTFFPNNFKAAAETLLDLETSFFTEDNQLKDYCIRTTARCDNIEEAEYLFFPQIRQNDLSLISQANRGTMIYPDRSATLICGCTIGSGNQFTLSGPGIETVHFINMDNIPAEFWLLRENAIQYPLGWDVVFIDGRNVVGIPRTTIVQLNQ